MSVAPVSSRSLRPSRAAVLLGLASLALAGCASDPERGSASTASVAYGASQADYRAAFADVEPITLSSQTSGAPGSPVASYFEEYAAALDEWSGGKLTIDLNYADAIAPATEVDDAVADGRLDLGASAPTYGPDKYPATNSLIDLTFNVSQTPVVGTLQMLGMVMESSSNSEVRAELSSQGVHPLIPLYSAGNDGLACTEPRSSLADFEGKGVRVGARMQLPQFEGLGMSTVSIAFPEMFESLQRGVIDCTPASPLVGGMTGIFELAPHLIIDPAAGLTAASSGSFIVSEKVWNDLPPVAKQLLHDRLDVFLTHLLKATLDSYAQMVEQVADSGGQISPYASDARAALQATNEEILDDSRKELSGVDDPSAFVDALVTSSKTWHTIVTEELGFDEEMTPEEFVAWHAEQELEVYDGFVDRLFTDVLNEHRAE